MKKKILHKTFKQNLKIIILGLVFGLGIGYLQAAYQAPTNTPPNANKPAPLDEGLNNQIKTGKLTLLGQLTGQKNSESLYNMIVGGTSLLESNVFTQDTTIFGKLKSLSTTSKKDNTINITGQLEVTGNVLLDTLTVLDQDLLKDTTFFGSGAGSPRPDFPDFTMVCSNPKGELYPCDPNDSLPGRADFVYIPPTVTPAPPIAAPQVDLKVSAKGQGPASNIFIVNPGVSGTTFVPTLSWTANNVKSCTTGASYDVSTTWKDTIWNSKSVTGTGTSAVTAVVVPGGYQGALYTYWLKCSDLGNTPLPTVYATMHIIGPGNIPSAWMATVDLKVSSFGVGPANNITVTNSPAYQTQSITLHWTTTNAHGCKATSSPYAGGWNGSSSQGSMPNISNNTGSKTMLSALPTGGGTQSVSGTYTLECTTNDGKLIKAYATVVLAPTKSTTPATVTLAKQTFSMQQISSSSSFPNRHISRKLKIKMWGGGGGGGGGGGAADFSPGAGGGGGGAGGYQEFFYTVPDGVISIDLYVGSGGGGGGGGGKGHEFGYAGGSGGAGECTMFDIKANSTCTSPQTTFVVSGGGGGGGGSPGIKQAWYYDHYSGGNYHSTGGGGGVGGGGGMEAGKTGSNATTYTARSTTPYLSAYPSGYFGPKHPSDLGYWSNYFIQNSSYYNNGGREPGGTKGWSFFGSGGDGGLGGSVDGGAPLGGNNTGTGTSGGVNGFNGSPGKIEIYWGNI